MSDNFDGNIDRSQYESMSYEDLKHEAREYGLIDDDVSLEGKSEEYIDELIGRIIEAKAHTDSQNEEWDEQQDLIEQQRRDIDY